MVQKAVAHIKADGAEKAYGDFTNKSPDFIDRDLYVTVYDLDGKVLLLTHAVQPEHPEFVAEAALQSGADRALSRPFTLSYLVHVVHEMVTPFKPSVVLAPTASSLPLAQQ